MGDRAIGCRGGRDRDPPPCALGPTATIGREGRRNRLLQHEQVRLQSTGGLSRASTSTAIRPTVTVPQVRIGPHHCDVLSLTLGAEITEIH